MADPRSYFDHAATTPLSPAARAAMAAALGAWANPSSPHREGRRARAMLEEARARIAAALGWRHHLIFTSGATEAIAIALTRLVRPRPALVSVVEHAAVLRQREDALPLTVDAAGLVDPAALHAGLARAPGAVAAVQQVNSETGIIQPLDDIASMVRAAGGVLFADCAQGAGKLPLPDADLIAVSAHKLGGPPGIGALLVRDLALVAPAGQGQEQGYRLGTENLPAILGFAAALEDATPGVPQPWVEERRGWRAALEEAIRAAGGDPVGGASPRSPLIGSYRLPGVAAETQLIRLDLAGFAVSAGSACSSGSMRPSHVMQAMGLDERAAREVIRVSFGRTTTRAEIERFITAYQAIATGRRTT